MSEIKKEISSLKDKVEDLANRVEKDLRNEETSEYKVNKENVETCIDELWNAYNALLEAEGYID